MTVVVQRQKSIIDILDDGVPASGMRLVGGVGATGQAAPASAVRQRPGAAPW